MPLKKFRLNFLEFFKNSPEVVFKNCAKVLTNLLELFKMSRALLFWDICQWLLFQVKQAYTTFDTKQDKPVKMNNRNCWNVYLSSCLSVDALKVCFKHSLSKTTAHTSRSQIYVTKIEQLYLLELYLPVLIKVAFSCI